MKRSLFITMALLLFGFVVLVSNRASAESAASMDTKAATTMPMGFIRGNGVAKVEDRNLPHYASLIIEGPFEVSIDAKGDPMVRVMADENLIANVITKVEDHMLKIYSPTGFETNGILKVEIHNRDLSKIVATDRADVDIDNLDAPRFEVSISDETDVSLSGKATEFEAYLNDHARLKASHLQTKTAKVMQMGNSHAEVYARESLDLNITDAAQLFYYGNPTVVNKTMTGTAQLKPR